MFWTSYCAIWSLDSWKDMSSPALLVNFIFFKNGWSWRTNIIGKREIIQRSSRECICTKESFSSSLTFLDFYRGLHFVWFVTITWVQFVDGFYFTNPIESIYSNQNNCRVWPREWLLGSLANSFMELSLRLCGN